MRRPLFWIITLLRLLSGTAAVARSGGATVTPPSADPEKRFRPRRPASARGRKFTIPSSASLLSSSFSTPTASSSTMTTETKTAVADTARPHWTPRGVTAIGQSFLAQQKKNAEYRRKILYRAQSRDWGCTASTLTNPVRALKLTLAAFVVSEALNFSATDQPSSSSSPPWCWARSSSASPSLLQQWKKASDKLVAQANHFYQTGRQTGGLLRRDTWTNGRTWSAAVQQQVQTKYQWAVGVAVGCVASPALWTFGWTIWNGLIVAIGLAQCHRTAKQTYQGYYDFLKDLNHPLLFAVDDGLEDLLDLVVQLLEHPQVTILGVGEVLDDHHGTWGLPLPTELRRGLIFGACAGILAAL